MCISSHELSKTTNNHEFHRSLQICGPTEYGNCFMLPFPCLQCKGGSYTSVKFMDLWMKESFLSADCSGHMESENFVWYIGNRSHKVACNKSLYVYFYTLLNGDSATTAHWNFLTKNRNAHCHCSPYINVLKTTTNIKHTGCDASQDLEGLTL